MTTPQATSMSPPLAHAQMQQGSPQQQAQQQSQPQEKMFITCNGSMMTGSALLTFFDHAKTKAKNGNPVTQDTLHEMMWMLQQHYPQHHYLRGRFIEPPQKTRPDVLVELSKTGRLGAFFEAQKNAMLGHIEQRQMVGQNAAPNAGQQQHQQQPKKPMWPNARSPNMIPANVGQLAGQQSGQSSSPQMWPIFTPNMVPNGQVAQRRQVLGGLSVDPVLANGAMPTTMSRQQSFGRPHSAHPQTPHSPPSTTASGYDARSASQASQHATSPPLPSLPWTQSVPSASRASQQQSTVVDGHGSRPSSAGPYSQDIRSPPQASPFKTYPMSAGLPPGPNFRPPSTPIPPQVAGTHLTVPKSRRGSAPAMGMFPPPLSRSPSFQGEAPSLQRQQSSTKADKDGVLAKQHLFLENLGLTREDIQQWSPKKREKLKAKYEDFKLRQAASMQPPLARPDLKRKPGPATISSSRPKKQQLTIDLTAHRESQLRRQNEEPNCGFGASTTVIRSNPNSRQPSPQPVQTSMVPQLAFPRVEAQEAVYEALPPQFGIPEEDLLEHAQTHGICMSDLELSPFNPTELAQFGAPKADIRTFLDSFDPVKHVTRQQSIIGSPLIYKDPRFVVALNQARKQKGRDGVDVGEVGVDVDMGEFVRDEALAEEVGMSEQRAELEWGLMSVGVKA